MKKILDTLKKSEYGQSLVELALVLPLIVVVLFGTMEFGQVFQAYLTITSASREGARTAVIGNTNEAILDATGKLTTTLTEPDKAIVIINPSDPLARKQGIPLSVKITYPVKLYTPVLSSVLPNPVLLEASTTMRME